MHADYEDGVLELPDGKELTPRNLYWHAFEVIKGRWSEAEPYIMKDSHIAYYYARHIIRGRWPEAEPFIIKNPEWASYYAKYIIKGRWSEAEPIIMESFVLWDGYCKHFDISE